MTKYEVAYTQEKPGWMKSTQGSKFNLSMFHENESNLNWFTNILYEKGSG